MYRLSEAFGGKRKLRVQNVLEHPFPVRRAGMEFIHFNSNDPNRIDLTITYIFKKQSAVLFLSRLLQVWSLASVPLDGGQGPLLRGTLGGLQVSRGC